MPGSATAVAAGALILWLLPPWAAWIERAEARRVPVVEPKSSRGCFGGAPAALLPDRRARGKPNVDSRRMMPTSSRRLIAGRRKARRHDESTYPPTQAVMMRLINSMLVSHAIGVVAELDMTGLRPRLVIPTRAAISLLEARPA